VAWWRERGRLVLVAVRAEISAANISENTRNQRNIRLSVCLTVDAFWRSSISAVGRAARYRGNDGCNKKCILGGPVEISAVGKLMKSIVCGPIINIRKQSRK
jgi:hypothetical protein